MRLGGLGDFRGCIDDGGLGNHDLVHGCIDDMRLGGLGGLGDFRGCLDLAGEHSLGDFRGCLDLAGEFGNHDWGLGDLRLVFLDLGLFLLLHWFDAEAERPGEKVAYIDILIGGTSGPVRLARIGANTPHIGEVVLGIEESVHDRIDLLDD